MADLYGMQLPPLPLGTNPILPLGGQEVMDRAQYGGPTPEDEALYRRVQAEKAAQVVQTQAATQQATQRKAQEAATPYIDWQTYQSQWQHDPADAYNFYINVDVPKMLAARGATPEQIAETQAEFMRLVPRPERQPEKQGFLSNTAGALTQAGRQLRQEFAASKALAATDTQALAELAKEHAGEEELTPEALKHWQKTGGLVWNDIPKTVKNLMKEPQGAMDAALQAVVSFAPVVGAGIAGSFVTPVLGTAAGVGAASAAQAAGSVALNHIARGLQEEKIDPNNIPAVKQWITDNWTKLFGDAAKSGATNGAISALTMGVAGRVGAGITKSLAEAAQVGVAEATARAAGVEATRVGTATAASLRAAQRLPTAGKIAGEVGGFGAAGVAGAYAAGDTPDPNDVFTASLTMLLPSVFGARGQFKRARTVEPLKPGVPAGTEKRTEVPVDETKQALGDADKFPPPVDEAVPGIHPDYEAETTAYRNMAAQRMDNEIAVREAAGLPRRVTENTLKEAKFAREVKDIAEANSTEAQADAWERLAAAADKTGRHQNVFEQAMAKAEELRSMVPPKEEEIVDTGTALHLARDIVTEGIQDHAQEIAQTVKAEIAERQGTRATPGIPPAAKTGVPGAVPPAAEAAPIAPIGGGTLTGERPAGPAADVGLQQGVVGEAQGGPGFKRGTGVNQEIPDQAVVPVPELGQPAGPAGGGGAPVVAGPERARGVSTGEVIAQAATGQPFEATLMRGQGRVDTPYNPLVPQHGVLGEGRYTTTDREFAEYFGPDVTTHQVALKNPLVISSDKQWRALTQRAGWPFPNPISMTGDTSKAAAGIKRLRAQIEADGHDGVIVKVPATEAEGKTMQKVFGADQVVEFNPTKPDLTIDAKNKTLLEQRALIKELEQQGIPSQLAFGRSGRIEFKTPEDKANAEAYLADKQANIDKVKAALTSRAGDVVEPESPLKKGTRNADVAYMAEEMGYDRKQARELYDEDPQRYRDEIDAHKKEAAQPGLKRGATPEENEALKKAVAEGLKKEEAARVPEGEHGRIFFKDLEVPLGRDLHDLLVKNKRTSTEDALRHLAVNGEGELTRLLAKTLLRVVPKDFHIPVNLVDGLTYKGKPVAGLYHSYEGGAPSRIELDSVLGLNQNTLLHEITHAATQQALRYPTSNMQRMAARRMMDIYEQALKADFKISLTHDFYGGEGRPYGLKDVLEFVAEAFSNPAFQKALDRVEYRDPMGGRLKIPTVWQAFKDAVARLLSGDTPGQKPSLLHAAIAHSADLFDSNLNQARLAELSKNKNKLPIESAAKEKKAEEAFSKTPHDAILGVNADGTRTHIAYRQSDGTYNMYEVNGTTAEQLKGDAETKRIGLSPEEVRKAVVDGGAGVVEKAGEDFRAEPKNTRTELNGWKEGKRQFAAFQRTDGQWNVYQGDDLSIQAQRPPPTKYKDLDAVLKEYRKHDFLKTQAQDKARMRDAEPKDMMKYLGPNKHVLDWWNEDAPGQYLGEQVKQKFKDVPEEARPDLYLTLRNSFINREVRNFERDKADPVVKEGRQLLKKHGKSGEDFDKDAAAIHYVERGNAKLANPGIEDLPGHKAKVQANLKDAQDHVATLDKEYVRELEDYMRKLKSIADDTIDYKVKNDLLPAEKGAAIKAAYEYYVPLVPEGQIRISGTKRATGASASTDHPIQRIIDQQRSAIIQNYNNKVTLATKRLAEEYNIVLPDGTKLFEIGPVLKYGFDNQGNLTRVLDPLVMDKRAVMGFEKGEPFRMLVNDKDMQATLKGRSPAEMNFVFHSMATFNALYAAAKTQLSPRFAMVNLIRDVETTLAQVDPRIRSVDFLSNMKSPSMWFAAVQDAFEVGKHKVGGATNKYAKLAAEARDAGAFIDRRSMYGYDNVVEDIRANIDPNWKDNLGHLKRKLFDFEHGGVFKTITAWTKTLENVTRMSVYYAGKKAGLSDMEAASAAKTATVNFEPKGRFRLSPWYVFANAKLQGTRTYAERMGATGLKGGETVAERAKLGLGKTQAITGLGFFMGMLAAKYGYDTSDKNEHGTSTYGDLSDYQKNDFLTVKSGGVSIPIAPELSWAWTAGQAIVDAFMNDRWADPGLRQQKAATRFGTHALQTFFPGGTSMSDPIAYTEGGTASYWMRLLLPTPLGIGFDLASGKSTWGTPIVTGKEKGVPLYATNREAAPRSAEVAQYLHDKLGANFAPQQYSYIFNQLVGPQIQQFNAVFGEPEVTATGKPKQNVFERTFFQAASPFTSREDMNEIHKRIEENTYDPLKKGKVPQLQMFEQADKQVSAALKGWKKATPEQRARMDENVTRIRARTLKKYQEAIQQAEGTQP